MRATGLTLVEVLAAAVLLGVLAVALVPMQMRIAERRLRSDDVIQAQYALKSIMSEPGFDWHEGQRQVPGHAEWRVTLTRLSPTSDPGLLIVPHHWWRVRIVRPLSDTTLVELVTARVALQAADGETQ